MKITLEQAMQEGVVAHTDGKLEEAERIYRSILQVKPNHGGASHNLGLVAKSAGKINTAIKLFKTALEANPEVKQFWLSYIDALLEATQVQNARRVIDQAKRHNFPQGELTKYEAILRDATEAKSQDGESD